MRTVLLLLAALVLSTACTFSHDDEGHVYPPDLACDDLQACFDDKHGELAQCYGQIPDSPPDYDGALWACFEGLDCLHTSDPAGNEETSREGFEDFIAACFGDSVGADHPLDAAWDDSFWTSLEACLVGSKANQELTIDVCYE